MLDLGQLLPHGKRDAKLDTKSERGVINEVADMKVGGSRAGGRARSPAAVHRAGGPVSAGPCRCLQAPAGVAALLHGTHPGPTPPPHPLYPTPAPGLLLCALL